MNSNSKSKENNREKNEFHMNYRALAIRLSGVANFSYVKIVESIFGRLNGIVI